MTTNVGARSRPTAGRCASPPERRAAAAAAGDDPHAREREREAEPGQRAGLPRPVATAISATSAGVAPTISEAWLTLVRSMPAFWSTITMP